MGLYVVYVYVARWCNVAGRCAGDAMAKKPKILEEDLGFGTPPLKKESVSIMACPRELTI